MTDTVNDAQPDELDKLTELVCEALLEAGYRAQTKGPGLVGTSTSGFKISLVFSNERIVQFRCGVSSNYPDAELPAWLKLVNDFNCEYRFAKAYIDSDNDLVMTVDIILFGQEPSFRSYLDELLGIVDNCLGLFRRALLDVELPDSDASGLD
jgi:hypothetical protein